MYLEPPNSIINLNEWVQTRQAAQYLGVTVNILYSYIYNFVFKNMLYIDGNIFLNTKELEIFHNKIKQGQSVLPKRASYDFQDQRLKYNPRYKLKEEMKPKVDMFERAKGENLVFRVFGKEHLRPTTFSYSEVPKDYLWIFDAFQIKKEGEKNEK